MDVVDIGRGGPGAAEGIAVDWVTDFAGEL